MSSALSMFHALMGTQAGAPPPPTYAVWDAARKGSGVTLTNSNLTAAMSGSAYNMVALTHAVMLNTSQLYYCEVSIDVTTAFIGFGIAGGSTLVDQYLGNYSKQFCLWADGSYDYVSDGNITTASSLAGAYTSLYGSPVRLKFCMGNNKFWFGRTGLGWHNGATGANNTGDPATNVGAMLLGISADPYSIATSGVGSGLAAKCTIFTDPSSWLDAAPAGAIACPG